MRKGWASVLSALMCVQGVAVAAPVCSSPQDALAVNVAAAQQELMVAALVCQDTDAYNRFVLSHQAALRMSDRNLMLFFQTANIRTGFNDYNYFKTELANAASSRSIHDPYFCDKANANFSASEGRPLEVLIADLPYPVETGEVHCLAPTAPVDTAQASLTRSAPAAASSGRSGVR